MKLLEHQAKEILSRFGIPVPRGTVVETAAQAAAAAEVFGPRVVLKAQVLAGGRGKAGGIKTALGPEDARAKAEALFKVRLITPQTGTVKGSPSAESWSKKPSRSGPSFISAPRSTAAEAPSLLLVSPQAASKSKRRPEPPGCRLSGGHRPSSRTAALSGPPVSLLPSALPGDA